MIHEKVFGCNYCNGSSHHMCLNYLHQTTIKEGKRGPFNVYLYIILTVNGFYVQLMFQVGIRIK